MGHFSVEIMRLPGQLSVEINRLAYDSLHDALIIGRENGNTAVRVIEWRSLANNTVQRSLTVAHEPDQLYFEATSGPEGALYYTFGDAGAGKIGYVVKVDVATGAEVGRYALTAADAIEGVFIDRDRMWIANDAYFHRGNPAQNRVLEYEIKPEAYALDVRTSTTALTIDLSLYDQTLSDGRHLVGVDRLFFHGGRGADIVLGGKYEDILVGGAGNDRLDGRSDNDRLVGAAGDDVLIGGAGDDGLEGGAGTDTAAFNGKRSEFGATMLSSGSVKLSDLRSGAPEGVDKIQGVEKFLFTDGTVTFAQLFSTAAPTLALANLSILENSPAGTQVSLLLVQGSSDLFTYTLLDTAGGRFALASGKVIAGSVAADYEQSETLSIVVQARSASTSIIQSFTLSVGDVNEAATAIVLANGVASIAENSPVTGGVRVSDLLIVDDKLGTNTLAVAGADAGSFQIRTLLGVSTLFYTGTSPDFETKSSYTVSIVADDATLPGSPDIQRLYTLAVIDVAEGSGGSPAGPTQCDDRGATAIMGTSGPDSLLGLGGNDQLFGLTGADTLDGGTGNDELFGGQGADVLIGGDGSDTAVYSDLASGIRADLTTPFKNTGDALGDTYLSIENLAGSDLNDTLVGNNSANILTGGEGNDSLQASGSSDTLYGGDGDDYLAGQGGNDRLNGGAGNDRLSGGSSARDWFIFTGAWNDDLILDFEDGLDLLDLRGNALTYSSLQISQFGIDVLITAPGLGSILVTASQTTSWTAGDFLF